jgi:hypothetical protein
MHKFKNLMEMNVPSATNINLGGVDQNSLNLDGANNPGSPKKATGSISNINRKELVTITRPQLLSLCELEEEFCKKQNIEKRRVNNKALLLKNQNI